MSVSEVNEQPGIRQRTLRLAAVQMVSGPEVAANLAIAGKLIAEAVAQGAQLVALPEYFPVIGADDDERLEASEAYGSGPVQDFLSATARRHAIWLVGGTLPLKADTAGRIRNSCLVYSPEGQRVARYDKIHLFAFEKGAERYDEASFIEPGTTPVAIDTPLARIGLSVCYDVRFPELYRALGRENGADRPLDLIIVPAAFTETTGRAHWEILLRARAIENQCYVMAIGQGGVHSSGRETHGNSMIIDPWGTILDRKLKGPGVVIADLDYRLIAEVRASLPALQHRVL